MEKGRLSHRGGFYIILTTMNQRRSIMTLPPETQERFAEGMQAFVNKNYKEAVDKFSTVIDQVTDYPLAYVSRGSAHNRAGKLENALNDFNKAIELKPEYARAYHLRGLLHEKMEQDEKALKDIDKAVELNPEYGAAYYSRAGLHAKMGNEDRAMEDINMVTMITEQNIGNFANENNIWRSHQLRLEAEGVADVMQR